MDQEQVQEQPQQAEREELCFTGTFDHTLDAKGRVSPPVQDSSGPFLQTVKTVLGLQTGARSYVFSPKAYKAWYDSFFPERVQPAVAQRREAQGARSMAFAEDADIDSAGPNRHQRAACAGIVGA